MLYTSEQNMATDSDPAYEYLSTCKFLTLQDYGNVTT